MKTPEMKVNPGPQTHIDRIVKSRWFGPVFALLILAPGFACIIKGGVNRWPYQSYEMYSTPWTPEKYANYHRVAVGILEGEPIWWKPGFEYRARNVSARLSRAFSLSDPLKRDRLVIETLQYVDHYLSTLSPDAEVPKLYVFKREVQPDWQIKDTLVHEVFREKLRND